MVVSVKWATQANRKNVVAVRGRGLRSFAKRNPTRVAPPMSWATGKVCIKPKVSPGETKSETQYQARMKSHGLLRLTGTSPRITARTRISLTVGARRAGCRARGPLFPRDALGEVARLIHVAPPPHGD